MADNPGQPGQPGPSGQPGQPGLFGERDPVFRPWPLQPKQAPNIAEFVTRLKAQGIEFRELSDEGLRKQIEEEKRQEQEGRDGSTSTTTTKKASKASKASKAAAGIDEALARPKGREAMMARRDEVIMSLINTVQSGAICLDLVSLLLSKDRPTQALQTLSNVRDKVGIGTLSAGRIANAAQAARALQIRSRGGAITAADLQNLDETTRTNAERLLEHKTECVGWQLLAMDRASDMLRVAQKRLHTQMRREQRYWSEMLAVQERGWCLSRVPGQRRVLRVKFGFSEAAPDLRPLGFAPMHRAKGRHVALDLSFLGPPTAVVLTLRRKTTTTTDKTDGSGSESGSGREKKIEFGRSHVPTRLPASAALEDRILEARNTIFAKELWRELGREVRLLVAHDVVFRDNTIVFAAGAHTEGILSLETLRLKKKKPATTDDDQATRSPELDNMAEAICTSLHLLLTHGHREHYNKRSQPGPPVDTTASLPTYCMLRAVVANLKYEMALKHLAQCLANVCGLLHGVSQTGSRFTLYERPITAPVPMMPPPMMMALSSASERLCAAFLTQREFSFEYTINEHTRLLIRSRTYIALVKVQYLVQLLPPSPGNSGGLTVNPLQETFPPADAYSTLQDVMTYVHDATAHVLAMRALAMARAWEARAATRPDRVDRPERGGPWTMSADGMGIRQTRSAFSTLRFGITAAADKTGDARALLDDGFDDDDPDTYVNNDFVGPEGMPPLPVDSPLEPPAPAELHMDVSWPADNEDAAYCKTWTWSAAWLQAQPGSVDVETLIEGCVSEALRPKTAN